MTEISLVLLALLIESLVVAVVLLVIWTVVGIRRKSRDRRAAQILVEQIKHQSQTRLESTGSFLNEKYRFEGDELKKAVKDIDTAEKKFFKIMIDVYLQRDSNRLESMDASLAELIDTYKSLSPVMPEATTAVDEDAQAELDELRRLNESLKEELSITQDTIANMISEFGNMFGGGHEHELDKREVIEKVEKSKPDDENGEMSENAAASNVSPEVLDEEDIVVSADDIVIDEEPAVESPEPEDDEVLADEGVEELLNGIDLSSDK